MKKYVPCNECGGQPCICMFGASAWAAHCMDCENTIGKRGFYDPCATSEEDAETKWNEMNTMEADDEMEVLGKGSGSRRG